MKDIIPRLADAIEAAIRSLERGEHRNWALKPLKEVEPILDRYFQEKKAATTMVRCHPDGALYVGNILDAKVDAILHQTNCKGVMGGGLALQIRKKFPEVYDKYQEYVTAALYNKSRLLGTIQTVQPNVGRPVIINVFGQDAFGTAKRYTSYDALEEALSRAAKICAGTTVAIPYKMSCGLAGGNWEIVKAIIRETIGKTCDVQIWRLPTVPLDRADIPGELRYFGVWLLEEKELKNPDRLYDKVALMRGVREPTKEEAELFLRSNMDGRTLRATDVVEYSRAEAEESFKFDDYLPVFGMEVVG